MPQTGLILKAVSSFYTIEYDNGTVLCCRARGRFRLDGMEPTPGDRVRFETDENHPGYGILVAVEPRRNYFIRPNIANVDQIVFVASEARPKTDPYLIDKLSVAAKSRGRFSCLDLSEQRFESFTDICSNRGRNGSSI